MIGPAAASNTTAARVSGRTALLAGATGLVGGHCLELLAADDAYARVIVLVRRELSTPLPPKVEAQIVDFDHLEQLPEAIRADDVFCALGTTIRQAGSPAAFTKVDLDYVVNLATWSLQRGAQHFLVVSSLGANAQARVLYSRVKGEMEEAVRALPFRAVSIFRPSLLLGDRKEFRLGEEIAKRFGFLMPTTYKPIHAGRVAAAMIATAKANRTGSRIIESAEIQRIGTLPERAPTA